jgi:predicted nicotinamide N-methyase
LSEDYAQAGVLNVDRQRRLIASLAPIGSLRRSRVRLPGADVRLTVRRPKDFDRLLEMAAPDPEQNLPYWAELWPSGIALAAKIAREPAAFRGQRVLELGSGLGVTAIAALRAGADLLVTDYAPEALALCALNTLDEAGIEPEALRLNWRDPSREFIERVGDGFPIVLAADVLYERRDVEPLLGLVNRIVTSGGALWLAEPGRAPAASFVEAIVDQGWRQHSERWSGPWPDLEDNAKGVVVTIHVLRKPASQ